MKIHIKLEKYNFLILTISRPADKALLALTAHLWIRQCKFLVRDTPTINMMPVSCVSPHVLANAGSCLQSACTREREQQDVQIMYKISWQSI